MPEGGVECPLSPSLPRDCGHECRVCQVTVVGLTDYADHISSTMHKQLLETREQEGTMGDPEEDYFNKELEQLIESRKVLIRKEEEAAAKRAREVEERQQQHTTWNEERQWLRQKGASWDWRYTKYLQPKEGSVSYWGGPWHGCPSAGRPGGSVWHGGENPRGWHGGRQEKSATWHAEGPPNLQTWSSGNRAGESFHQRGGQRWDYEKFLSQQKGHSLWPGSGASPGGPYNRVSDLHWAQRKEPLRNSHESVHEMDFTNDLLPPSNSYDTRRGTNQEHGRSSGSPNGGYLNWEGSCQDEDRGNSKGPKPSNTSQKQDKTYRWAPYPPAKLSVNDVLPVKVLNTCPLDKYPKSPPVQVTDEKRKHDRTQGPYSSQRQRPSQQGSADPSHCFSEDKDPRDPKTSSNQSSSGSSSQGDRRTSSSSSQQRAAKGSPGPKAPLNRASSQDSELSNSSRLGDPNSHSLRSALSLPEQNRQLSELLRSAKERLLDITGSAADHKRKAVRHTDQEQAVGSSEIQGGTDGGKTSGKDRGLPPADQWTGSLRHTSYREETVTHSAKSPTNNSLSLQSVQVSTSTMESSGAAVSAQGDGSEYREREEAARAMQTADEGLGSDTDVLRGGHSHSTPGSTAPAQNKLSSVASLTRHISTKGRGGGHEPNLNIARRIRNLSGTRKCESERDSSLKPTLRQLISFSGARRNVNWDQVYQQVNRRKQQQGKGMPRFGIEMVPFDQEGPSHPEQADVSLSEGFHWESLFGLVSAVGMATPRKRSLSESSVATDRTAAALSLLTAPGEQPPSSQTHASSHGQQQAKERQREKGRLEPKTEGEGSPGGAQSWDCVVLDGSLGTEQNDVQGAELNDVQGAGTKRRAAGDIPSPEVCSLERKNKRLKVKSKKERSLVDQLLTVSLREEELNRSLHDVDGSLSQARATLQLAYMEVQRLLVVKQQVSMEMSALRSKRIEILKGLQDDLQTVVQPSPPGGDDEKTAVVPVSSALSTHSAALSPSQPSPACPAQLPRLATPPSSLLSSNSVQKDTQTHPSLKDPRVKEEDVIREPDPTQSGSLVPFAPLSLTAACTESTLPGQTSPVRTVDPRKTSTDVTQGSVEMSSESKESLSGVSQSPAVPQSVERSRKGPGDGAFPSADLTPRQSPASATRRSLKPEGPTSYEALPPTQPGPRKGRSVRKLKKRRVLKKAGVEPPENSDTEAEPDPARPLRRLRVRRRAGGSPASTSSQPATERDKDRRGSQQRRGAGSLRKGELEDSGSPLEMVELPRAPLEVVSILSSSPEEGCVGSPAPAPACRTSTPAPPDTERTELKLACSEVTSTSEMDISAKPCDSEVHLSRSSLNVSSADVSSDPGGEEKPTEGVFEGHQEAVNAMQIHGGLLYTCSGDRTVKAFHLVSRKCVGVFEGHGTKVNCLLVTDSPGLQNYLYSGSSDQSIRCYNLTSRKCVDQFLLADRVLCLHSRWNLLYAGLANGTVVTFSLKSNRLLDVFECHGPRAVSCLATAQEGARRVLLVGSYDSTISVRDATSGLLLRTLEGHTKTVLCMKVVNDLVFSGSSDQTVHAHNIHTGELVQIYKGHSHAVTVVAILGSIMITACLDKRVRLFELQSHDLLQVYGGHKDMVMCMVVHKSMIYTGCYDGSIQAVRLNLKQSYRCLWHGCSLVFGVSDHLLQHLLAEHTSQTTRCCWRKCDASFSSRSKQMLLSHIQKHSEEDSRVEP